MAISRLWERPGCAAGAGSVCAFSPELGKGGLRVLGSEGLKVLGSGGLRMLGSGGFEGVWLRGF